MLRKYYNFDFHQTIHGKRWAKCKVCGERYHVNEYGDVRINRQTHDRCMVYHPQQNDPLKQIQQSIAFHQGQFKLIER